MLHKNQTSHATLIGKIIFANLLKQPLKKYKSLIEEVEHSYYFKKLQIKVIKFSQTKSYYKKDLISSNVIAQIVKKKNSFGIKYSYKGFNTLYVFCLSSFTNRRNETERLRLLHKLRRINSRNELTYKVLKGIIKYQKTYLKTNNPSDLAKLSQEELVSSIKSKVYNCWISRLISKVSILTPQEEIKPLKFFFISNKLINKYLIKEILDRESKLISSGKIQKPYSDNKIKNILQKQNKSQHSRWSIGICRKELGIPSSNKRMFGNKYPPFGANFSILYPLNIKTINSNAPCTSGIYEISLITQELKYPNGQTSVIYIGRAKNLRKRLKDHLVPSNKNSALKKYLKKNKCIFRYVQEKQDLKTKEKELYKLFVKTYGEKPRCNKVSP